MKVHAAHAALVVRATRSHECFNASGHHVVHQSPPPWATQEMVQEIKLWQQKTKETTDLTSSITFNFTLWERVSLANASTDRSSYIKSSRFAAAASALQVGACTRCKLDVHLTVSQLPIFLLHSTFIRPLGLRTSFGLSRPQRNELSPGFKTKNYSYF